MCFLMYLTHNYLLDSQNEGGFYSNAGNHMAVIRLKKYKSIMKEKFYGLGAGTEELARLKPDHHKNNLS